MKTAMLGAATLAASANAAIITQWSFNDGDGSTSTGTTNPSIGVGLASLLGGATATFASGNSGTGSSDPEVADDAAWNLSTWAAQGTGSGTRGARFNVSTVGFQSIIVTWDNRHSNTFSKYVRFEYTTDGTNFSSAGIANGGVFEASSGGDTWYNNRSVDLTGVAGVANNANFAFRVVAIFAPSTSSYAASTTSSSYGTTGTLRFDMVTVNGAVPAPASALLMSMGALAIGRRRR